MEQKTIQLLNYLAIKEGGIFNKSRVLILTWLCDRLMLKEFEVQITENSYVINPKGVIPISSRFILENYIKYKRWIKPYYIDFYKSVEEDFSIFSVDEIDIVESVWKAYGSFSKDELRRLAMEFPEFQEYFDVVFSLRGIEIPVTTEQLLIPFNDPAGLFAP